MCVCLPPLPPLPHVVSSLSLNDVYSVSDKTRPSHESWRITVHASVPDGCTADILCDFHTALMSTARTSRVPALWKRRIREYAHQNTRQRSHVTTQRYVQGCRATLDLPSVLFLPPLPLPPPPPPAPPPLTTPPLPSSVSLSQCNPIGQPTVSASSLLVQLDQLIAVRPRPPRRKELTSTATTPLRVPHGLRRFCRMQTRTFSFQRINSRLNLHCSRTCSFVRSFVRSCRRSLRDHRRSFTRATPL